MTISCDVKYIVRQKRPKKRREEEKKKPLRACLLVSVQIAAHNSSGWDKRTHLVLSPVRPLQYFNRIICIRRTEQVSAPGHRSLLHLEINVSATQTP